MTTKVVELPCSCSVTVNTEQFASGDRGVSCSRHERAFVISAVLPKDPVHEVTREIRYEAPKEGA